MPSARASVNVRAIAQGASERNISVVVEGRHATRALRAVHAGFYLSPHTISIGVIGPGHRGQGAARSARARRARGCASSSRSTCGCAAFCGSKRMLLAETGIPLERLARGVRGARVAADLDALHRARARRLPAAHGRHRLHARAPRSPRAIADWLGAGIHIVTPTRRPTAPTSPTTSACTRRAARAARTTSTRRRSARGCRSCRRCATCARPATRSRASRASSPERSPTCSTSTTAARLLRHRAGCASSAATPSPIRAMTSPAWTSPASSSSSGGRWACSSRWRDVKVESLVPAGARGRLASRSSWRACRSYDAPMRERLEDARARGKVLRYVGRALRRDGRWRRSGWSSSTPAHPFANIALTDNVVRFATRALPRQPAHRAGAGRRTRGHRGRRVRRPAAPRRLPRSAAVSGHASQQRATAFAPASVGNVAIGFDILGFAVDALGDRVTVTPQRRAGRAASRAITRRVPGRCRATRRDNTAGRALLAHAARRCSPASASRLQIDKGIPLGSGLGGSAASAVGAVVAANALLPQPLQQLELLQVRHAGRGGGERLAARRQHRAVAVRRAGAHRRHRPSAREADSGAGRASAR